MTGAESIIVSAANYGKKSTIDKIFSEIHCVLSPWYDSEWYAIVFSGRVVCVTVCQSALFVGMPVSEQPREMQGMTYNIDYDKSTS